MKMPPLTLIALLAIAGGAFYAAKTSEVLTLVPGGKYQIIAQAVGPEGTNWKGVYDELTAMGVKDVVIKGKGDTRSLTYTSTPTKSVVMQEGKPLFQVGEVDVSLKSVLPLGKA